MWMYRESRDQDAILHFAWIPSVIVRILLSDASLQYVFSSQQMTNYSPRCRDRRLIKVEVEATIFRHILPLPSKDEEESQWVDRLLIVLQHMGENDASALLSLMAWVEYVFIVSLDLILADSSFFRRGPYGPFIDACEKNNVSSVWSYHDNQD